MSTVSEVFVQSISRYMKAAAYRQRHASAAAAAAAANAEAAAP